MSVKNETIYVQKQELTDDVSNEETVSTDLDGVSTDKLAALKAKMAKKQEGNTNMPPRIVEKKKKSLKFGVVGSGQAGSRIAESFYELGYQAVVFNTASQDLEYIKVPEENKYLLEFSIGGAAKDLSIGADAAESNRDGIANLVSDKLDDSQVLLFCTSLGGGSGAGSCETMVDILSATGRPVVVVTVLPMTTDDAQTKNNALQTLSKLAKLAQSKKIANLIVVDNSKIESIYTDVSQMDFFKVSNAAIVEPIDVFNKFSSQPSAFKALDSMEFAKLFTDGEGLTVYGELSINNYEDETAIAEAIVENLSHGLLAGGFDLKQTRYAGTMIIAHSDVWAKIPSGSVNYAMALIQETCPQAISVFRGLYTDDSMDKDVVKVYSMFSGLGLPTPRVEQLKKEAHEEMAKAKNREQNRNLNLQLDTGVEESASQADKVREMIKKKNSGFNKNFTGVTKDFRKK
jgi:cell division GTPase FtsZ